MEKKMTKREYFAQIREMVADNTELVAFIDHEVELLDKKNSSKGMSKTAKANVEIKANILQVMSDKAWTIGQLTKEYNSVYDTDFSANKISALVSRMRDDKGTGEVHRYEEKGVAYFKANPTEPADTDEQLRGYMPPHYIKISSCRLGQG